MKILSLFDGMACGMLAMQKAGISVDKYDAYEIDKYAIQTAQHNFSIIEEHGDVFKADFMKYENVDYLIGGSPCTYWSIAQKNNRETEASGLGWELFSQYVRALKEAKPKYFIYENNKSMSRQIRASIDDTFGFEAIGINSALVSAQNRQRLYWVGKRNTDGTYSRVPVEQPEDKGILLKDILEQGEDLTSNEKSYCLTATYDGAASWNTIERKQRTMVAIPLITAEGGKSFAVTATEYKGSNPEHTIEKRTRTMVIEHTTDNFNANKIYEVKNGFITIKDKQYPIKLADGFYIIRKLTVLECMRLQTVPEWYSFPVSNSQAYKLLGNGWTVDVIAHILSFAKEK